MFGYIDVNNWSKDETVAPIVRAAFPSYRKKKVSVKACESVTLMDLNWSGGTRSEYRAVSLSGLETGGSTLRYSALHPMNNYAEGKTVAIPEGMCMVRGGTLCGKESTITIYVNPKDMPKLLVSP